MITVAGTLVADVSARPIADLPPRGRMSHVQEVTLQVGGAVGNTGKTLACLGVPVSAVGRVGVDNLGLFVRDAVAEWALDPQIVEDPAVPTSSTVVLVHDDGERTFLHALGASSAFKASDISLDHAEALGSRALHVGYALFLPAFDGEPMAETFREARARGLLVSLDVAWNPDADWASVRELLPEVDVFCPNAQEAQEITGQSSVAAAAQALFADGVRQVVAVTMGPEGCYIKTEKHSLYLEGFSLPVMDTTGAGDAFVAGLLAAWHRGLPWDEAARVANAAGALATTRPGASEGVGSWDAVMRMGS